MRLNLHPWLIVVSLLIFVPARAAEPEPLPTAEELRKLYADGEYKTWSS
jgi:hypothetical protein